MKNSLLLRISDVSVSMIFGYAPSREVIAPYRKFIPPGRRMPAHPLRIRISMDRKRAGRLKINENGNEIIYNRISYKSSGGKGMISATAYRAEFYEGGGCCLFIPERYAQSPLVIRNAIRCAFGFYVLEQGGFLLHSSSLVHDGKSVLFSGLPESGKTTIAGFGTGLGMKTQGDEFIFVKREGNRYFSYPTPFGGCIEGDAGKARISKLFFIKKSDRLGISRVSPEEAIPKVLQGEFATMGTHFSSRSRVQEQAFRNAVSFCREVPCYGLLFPFDKSFLSRLVSAKII